MGARERRLGPLTIPVEDVKETPRSFHLETDAAWWEQARDRLREPEARVRDLIALDLEANRIGRRLLFRGRLSGTLELECSRCLEVYPCPLEEPVELLLEPARAGEEAAAGGLLLDPEDTNLGRYSGETLDFDALVVEILALTWPMQPLCAESCQGLCPVCGVNRNSEPCDCSEGTAVGPFRELGRLLEARRRQG